MLHSSYLRVENRVEFKKYDSKNDKFNFAWIELFFIDKPQIRRYNRHIGS